VLDLEFNRQLIFRQCSKSVIDFETGNGDGEETTGEQKFVCLSFNDFGRRIVFNR
jgi:hypothetical protein